MGDKTLQIESEEARYRLRVRQRARPDSRYDWRAIARASQIAPAGDWLVWLIRTGRGWGKTRTGAEWVREQVELHGRRRIALVAETAADARDVMVEGESGLMAISPPWNRPVYEPSKRRLTWPNGAIATTYSAEEPDQLRGPQSDAAWCDELAKWKYLDRKENAWSNLMFGLRLGAAPRVVVTTTPRPLALLKDIIADPLTVVTAGHTYENLANLSPTFRSQVVARYEGTRLGRQELEGQVLDDVPGALWRMGQIDDLRLHEAPDLTRIVVAIDPSGGSDEEADEQGIIVAGRALCACQGDGKAEHHGFVLSDLSGHYTPQGWAARAINAYAEHGADLIVAEKNYGGDMVENTIRTIDPSANVQLVSATRGKLVRAQPVAALYEQMKIHHVGRFDLLEEQMCYYTPDSTYSPDRMDALVWALTELMVTGGMPNLRFLD